MALSGYFLYLVRKTHPIGTATAVRTGFGAAGAFLIGVRFFGDVLTLPRCRTALACC